MRLSDESVIEGGHLTPEERIALQAEEIKQLWQENEQLRAVLENAKETLEMLHPTMNPDEPCFIYETWDAVSKALGGTEDEI